MSDYSHGTIDCPIVLLPHVPIVWATPKAHIGLRSKVHLTFQQSTHEGTRDHLKPVNSLPPTDQWPYGAKELMGRTIPSPYHGQLRRLDHGITNCHLSTQ